MATILAYPARKRNPPAAADEIAVLDEAATARLVARLPPHELPLYQAALRGEIGIIRAPLRAPFPAGALGQFDDAPVAVLVLIGDDAHGPSAFPAAAGFARWAKAAVIASEPDHYRNAVALTRVLGRLLLIEASADLVPAWKEFFADLGGVLQ